MPDPVQPDRRLLCGEHTRGYLPHLKAEGGTYFVTFRLDGTLPQPVLDQFLRERETILRRVTTAQRVLSREERRRLHELFSERIDRYLDAGHSDCWLGRPAIAQMVRAALTFFEGTRYDLHAWVVMPNHVHVVVAPRDGHTLSGVLHSWKSYTANEANGILNRVGQRFWQPESYDHLIRDDEELYFCCEYTMNNPVAAGLCRRPEDWPYSSAYVPRAPCLPDVSA